ncbi:PRC-barrel domain containing protein [Altererythrobacter aerius]|uniref:PRC-barrel domain containing protein n=1 Tax=Tsuneonella aeria TaxID=1837929 RepID=A0A6I4TED9_9SPHN|nr:PRC-barrel domain-containing protein [Tsuneonella aeria]MXO74510.1 PRC-barrel domain containing protein [Tsuneonella aeria]
MARHLAAPALVAALLVSACGSEADRAAERTEDRIEQTADASAAQAGDAIAALGLTERQLLDAEIVDSAGAELGDVERVLRNAGGTVDRLLVELEDSNPDRYVIVPIDGFETVRRGDDTDLTSPMTGAQLDALPAADLSTT